MKLLPLERIRPWILLLAGGFAWGPHRGPVTFGDEHSSVTDSLGCVVPSDSALFVRWRLDGDGVLAAHLGRLAQAVDRSGVSAAFLRHLASAFPSAEVGEVDPPDPSGGSEVDADLRGREALERFLGRVHPSRFLAREVVLAVRVSDDRREFLVALRLAEGDGPAAALLLRGVFQSVSAGLEGFEILEGQRGSDRVVVLEDTDRGDGPALAVRGDLVLAASTKTMLSCALQLHDGSSSDLALIHTDAFRAYLDRVALGRELSSEGSLEVLVLPGKLLPDVPSLEGIESFALRVGSTREALHHRAELRFLPAEDPRSSLIRRAVLERRPLDPTLAKMPPGASGSLILAGFDPPSLRAFLGGLVLDLGGDGRDLVRDAALGVESDEAGGPRGAAALWRSLSGEAALLARDGEVGVVLGLTGARTEGRGPARAFPEVIDRVRDAGGVIEVFEGEALPGSALWTLQSGGGVSPIFGVAEPFLLAASSSEILPGIEELRSGKGVPVPMGDGVPSEGLLAVAAGKRPPLLSLAWAMGRILGASVAGDAPGAVVLGEAVLDLGEVWRTLGFLGDSRSTAVRAGDAIRSRGTIRLEPPPSPAREGRL